ncbi:S41 family peptidase [uncultured Aquimarina sp.]|uniref:S41 family peptidase n=1 Tax=uncultured Aquimarina sp. TaxID=575652 RepID=UPI0026044635|nr:S41 family peptidase [uncultured Aquimarina sp.]
MKTKLKYVIAILAIGYTTSSYSQRYTVKDSITVYTDSVFNILQKKNLYREKIDWASYKERFLKVATTKKSFKEFLPMFGKVWMDLGDKHTSINTSDMQIKNPTVGNFDGSEFSAGLLERYQQGNFNFECKVLDDQYGYILMPSIDLPDGKDINSITQKMYDQIQTIANNHKLKGWIIDLRLNMGGNTWPMIGALYELLGDGVFGGWKYEDRTEKIYLKNGKAYQEEDMILAIKRIPFDEMNTVKVAIVTGVFTNSSGEITAIAFKGRKNTIFIGEKTIGLTTTNHTYRMPFDTYFNNAEAYDVDRNGQFYEHIIPGIAIHKSDNFKNLLEDDNIKEAIKYFNNGIKQ